MAEKIITKIPQRIKPLSGVPLQGRTRRKVAGYARVSTDSEEQENSYEAQVGYFTDYIRNNPEWEFVKIYTDEGISGLNTKHREGFNAMIRDALAGKIDLIVTKSVSRFARNTVDTLTAIRELKAHGVEVYFQKENIYTFDGKGELMLTIMSSLAQEESRSISENVTWGIRKGFSDGKVIMPYGSFLGYCKGENGQPEIVPEEALIVQKIYRGFLEGLTPRQIARKLTQSRVPTPRGRDIWSESTILSILTNERYKGDARLQKSFCTDYLTKKFKKNEGEVPQYYVKNSHPAIVSPEVWELVQLEIEDRKIHGNRYSGKGAFASKVICGECGCFFGAKVWHSTDPYRTVIWRCNSKYEGTQRCHSTHVREDDIKDGFLRVMMEIIPRKTAVIAACQQVLNETMETESVERKLEALNKQEESLHRQIEGIVGEFARATIDKAVYDREYGELHEQYEAVVAKITKIEAELADKRQRRRRVELFIRMLSGEHQPMVYDGGLFTAYVDRVIVRGTKGNAELEYILRDGTSHTVKVGQLRG